METEQPMTMGSVNPGCGKTRVSKSGNETANVLTKIVIMFRVADIQINGHSVRSEADNSWGNI